MQDDIKSEKVRYLLQLLGRRRTAEEINLGPDDGFEDIEVNVFHQISTMLAKPPIAQDIYISETTEEQERVENVIEGIYRDLIDNKAVQNASLDLSRHTKFVKSLLSVPLPSYYYGYDANHGWMLYWLLNFCGVVGCPVEEYLTLAIHNVLGLLNNGGKS